MDDKDRTLLSMLRRNARQPLVALARGIDLSRSATQERLARLEKTGAIVGYTVVESAPSENRQSAYLMVSLKPGFKCAQVVPRLRAIPHLAAIDSVTGDIDIVVRVEAHSVNDIEAARAAISAIPGIAEVRTWVVLERHRT